MTSFYVPTRYDIGMPGGYSFLEDWVGESEVIRSYLVGPSYLEDGNGVGTYFTNVYAYSSNISGAKIPNRHSISIEGSWLKVRSGIPLQASFSVEKRLQLDKPATFPDISEGKELLEKVVEGKSTRSVELKAKQEAEAKALAELKAKQDAEVKAAAELKAKLEAEVAAKAAELKAKQEADAKAAAELKAKQEAAADKAALAKAQSELVAANAALADSQRVNREQAAKISSFEQQIKVLFESVAIVQNQLSQLNSKLVAALAGQNAANAKLKKVCSVKPKPKGC
jgi:chemotaxis protein histidine kinase CheA